MIIDRKCNFVWFVINRSGSLLSLSLSLQPERYVPGSPIFRDSSSTSNATPTTPITVAPTGTTTPAGDSPTYRSRGQGKVWREISLCHLPFPFPPLPPSHSLTPPPWAHTSWHSFFDSCVNKAHNAFALRGVCVIFVRFRLYFVIFGSKFCEFFDSKCKVVIFMDCQLIGKFQPCKQQQ